MYTKGSLLQYRAGPSCVGLVLIISSLLHETPPWLQHHDLIVSTTKETIYDALIATVKEIRSDFDRGPVLAS